MPGPFTGNVIDHGEKLGKFVISGNEWTVTFSDIFVNENENENFLKNENRIRTKINLSERIEINY
jgi:hypothetical protein